MNKEQIKSLIANCEEIEIQITGKYFKIRFYDNDVRIEYFDDYMIIEYCNGNMATDIKYEVIDEIIGI